MTSMLEWARGKLADAPMGSCVFWIDVLRLLEGAGLTEAGEQSLLDDRGREWAILRYRANPFAVRRALSDRTKLIVVWCTGSPGATVSDLTAFDDYLPRAFDISEISLRAMARELAPGIELPQQLEVVTRGHISDPSGFIRNIADEYGSAPVTLPAALNVLVERVTGLSGGLDMGDASRILASTALGFARSRDAAATALIKTALRSLAEMDAQHGTLLRVLAESEPHDVIATAHIGSGLARLGSRSISSVLVAEGICPVALRDAFDPDRDIGSWARLTQILSHEDLGVLAAHYEAPDDEQTLTHIRHVMQSTNAPLADGISELVAQIRFAFVLEHLESFASSDLSASERACLPSAWSEEVAALDALVAPLRLGRNCDLHRPEPGIALDQCARSYLDGPTSLMDLSVARANLALRQLQRFLTPAEEAKLSQRVNEAQQLYLQSADRWNQAWCAAIAADTGQFLNAPHQTWRRGQDFAADTKNNRWLLVFDGLRHDLWREVLAPAIRESGFRIEGEDFGFAYLPTITSIARRTLVGGAPSKGTESEASAAEKLASRLGKMHSYSLKAESFRREPEAPTAWNVRVFSWPDKLVHGDIMDLATLESQFRSWVTTELTPWLRQNLAHAERIAISSDHGFVALDPRNAVSIESETTDDRNSPRVLDGRQTATGASVLHLEGPEKTITLAACRHWFRPSGGRPSQFAHGGCTLDETLVPFAEVVPTTPGKLDVHFEGIPAELNVQEGETVELSFSVTASGGSDRHPIVEVNGESQASPLELGQPRRLHAPIVGTEGLTHVLIRVRANGSVAAERRVPVNVQLQRVGRRQLDLDI